MRLLQSKVNAKTSQEDMGLQLAAVTVSSPVSDKQSGTCYPEGCAASGQVPCQCNTRGSLSKLKRTPPQTKINVTSKSPVGDISVVTLIRTDTTLDHSQKAEKVCVPLLLLKVCNSSNNANGSDSGDASPPRGPGGPSRLSPRSNYFCAMCTTPPSGRLQGISV